MGFLSNVIRSWKKSRRLRELQLKIAPPDRTTDDVVTDFMQSLRNGSSRKEQALEQFLDLCESDEGVRKVMETEGITRADLKEIYMHLSAAGLGQWIKGHYAALSTIAYVEPLIYAVRSQKRGTDWQQVTATLLRYWENEIPQGGLLQQVR